MQTLRRGRPSVIVPFMSEQEMNGRQLVEATGSGLLLRKSRVDPVTYRITFTDRSSGTTDSPFVQAGDVRDAVNDVLGTSAMRKRAAEAGAELAEAERHADLPGLVKGMLGR